MKFWIDVNELDVEIEETLKDVQFVSKLLEVHFDNMDLGNDLW